MTLDSQDQFALRGRARCDDRQAMQGAIESVLGIEPEFGFAGALVRTVAAEAGVGENRQHVPPEIHGSVRRCAEGGRERGEDKQSEGEGKSKPGHAAQRWSRSDTGQGEKTAAHPRLCKRLRAR